MRFRLSHAPQGACGLKLPPSVLVLGKNMSRPARGVWIEMTRLQNIVLTDLVTPRKGRVD